MPAVEECQLADIQGRVARRGGLVNVHQPTNQGQTSALVTVASRTPRNTHCIHSHGHYQCQPNIYPPPTPANAQTLTVRMIKKPQSDEWLTAHTCLGSPARGKSAHFEGRKVERLLFACVLLCWDRNYRYLSKTFAHFL